MNYQNRFVAKLMNNLNFPEKAKTTLLKAEKKIRKSSKLNSRFLDAVDKFMYTEDASLDESVKPVENLGVLHGIHPYTIDMLFVLYCSEITHDNYIKKGFTEEFFLTGAKDFRYKLIECMKRTGIVGTFVAGWNTNFLKMERFTLGRFQYEYSEIDKDVTLKNGISLKKGDLSLNLHIPWSGVGMNDDLRMESYKMAYKFFRYYFGDKPMVIKCHSWLLYPRQTEFLNSKSNVLKFLNDFEIVESDESRNSGPGWRLYGKDYPTALLPSRNSLEKAYTDWFRAGNPGGNGLGIFVFDGEKIIK